MLSRHGPPRHSPGAVRSAAPRPADTRWLVTAEHRGQAPGNPKELCPAPEGTSGIGTVQHDLMPSCPAGERLARPTRVRFAAEIAHHLLRWEPGHNPPSSVLYEVEHKVYGTNQSWTAIPNCMRIPEHSCDLTYYTLNSAHRYYARVRAVSGNHTSPWQRTNSFSPQEASLRLSGQSLSVMGNTIHVQLQLLLRTGNLTVKYDDIQKHARRYRVYIRRARDNRTYEVMETSPEFNISNLFWDTEYCISVEPSVASRHSGTARTDEQCVTIGHRDRSEELVLSAVSSSFVTFLLLGLLGALLVCTYIKRPMRPPSVLKSFIKQSSLWAEQESSSSSSPDADPIQQLFLCQKEPHEDSVPISSTSTAQLPMEKGWRLPAWPEDKVSLLGPGTMRSRDSSGTSTDSGICLRTSSLELSCSSGTEPQGYKRQLPSGDDSGMGLESSCPRPTCSSGNTIPMEDRQPCSGELSIPPDTSQQGVEFRGYLQQSKGTVEPRQDPAKGMPFSVCAASLQGPGSTDIALDTECSELAVVKGYLKQPAPERPHSHTQDLAPWRGTQEPAIWDISSQAGPQGLLSHGAPGAPLASRAHPERLKAPVDLSVFNTDLMGTLPLVSSLSTNKWLMLQINPLSLLNGDSKDSCL
ncbi:interleukin-10 receptor subunit alpha isoform X1 [Pezoporus flaviventris]|uniref:interleukin-10 receptor subunit alpha isoform X1 n=1 Tax=Pezoporus flaviventris TaxID=889875 RepID=UPI002AAFD767|nr:interleukin-10 receptor subunit alpha isoform X1 [Pezoporus flaviventris]